MMRSAFDHDELREYQKAIGFVAWLEEAASGITSKVSACDHLADVVRMVAAGKRNLEER